ncbi:MAG: hypothetical protein ACLR5J_11620 [Lachnospiraceae bacterium]
MEHIICMYHILQNPNNMGVSRHILHYTSENLWDWTYQSTLQLSSERVIDACVYEVCPGVYKMWYKDENHDSHIYAAQSTDLYKWEVVGEKFLTVHRKDRMYLSLVERNG